MSNAETRTREVQIVIEDVVLKMHEIAYRLINWHVSIPIRTNQFKASGFFRFLFFHIRCVEMKPVWMNINWNKFIYGLSLRSSRIGHRAVL